jgi:hypothetical protein
MPTDFMSLFATLSATGARFVVVGGLASILHGVDRTTADIDVVVDLAADPLRGVLAALAAAGYRPMAPVDPADLADPAIRARWQRDQGMQVFSLWDSENRRPTVDILLTTPIPFETLLRDAVDMTFRGTTVKVASIGHLVQLKQHAGRPQDLIDIERLQRIALTNQPS